MSMLLEQAARVLDHQPTRSMEAEPLYRKAVREAGRELSFPGFVAALRRERSRFTVIEPDPVVSLSEGWDERHRTLYRAALAAAGLTQPIVILAERLTDANESAGDPDRPASPEDVFGDVHDSLTHMLRTADCEDPLYAALMGAVEELHLLRRLTAP